MNGQGEDYGMGSTLQKTEVPFFWLLYWTLCDTLKVHNDHKLNLVI